MQNLTYKGATTVLFRCNLNVAPLNGDVRHPVENRSNVFSRNMLKGVSRENPVKSRKARRKLPKTGLYKREILDLYRLGTKIQEIGTKATL